ncbi:MAG: glycosyltransferase, partial [Xanthomonadales bacterium]|nr:glycosyltransferase [Xanthomonadales bacterium]
RARGPPRRGGPFSGPRRLAARFRVIAVVPDAPWADPDGLLDGVEVVRYRYAPRRLQTLVNDGGIVANLKRSPWKWLLVPGFLVGQYLAARRVIRRYHVDIIHAHWLLPQGLLACRLSRRFGVSFVVTSHGGDLFGLRGRLLTALKRKVAGVCAAMTVVSTAMGDEVKRLGLKPRHLEVLPMGVNLQDRFVPDSRQHRTSDTLLFVGRLVPKKGLRYLLDAMPILLAKHPEAVLRIVGFGPDETALKRQAEVLTLGTHVQFYGPAAQQELPALYRGAAVFVAPFVRDVNGDQEGLPVALTEAMGCECPVVVGNVDGIHDLLGDAAASVAVQPQDVEALAAAILTTLDHPLEASKQARTMRAAVSARMDWVHIAGRYTDILGACIGQQSEIGDGS